MIPVLLRFEDNTPCFPMLDERDHTPLLHACIAGRADPAQRRQFADLWQQRVRSIVVDHAVDKQMFRMVAAAQGN